MKVVAVSACPSGLMHTYMAAESLEKAAIRKHINLKVETHGAIGVENQLTVADIETCDYVILMADVAIDETRFKGKPLISVSTAYAIHHAEALLEKMEINACNKTSIKK